VLACPEVAQRRDDVSTMGLQCPRVVAESHDGVSSIDQRVRLRVPVMAISLERGQELADHGWYLSGDAAVGKAVGDLPHPIRNDELCDGCLLPGSSHAIQFLHHVHTALRHSLSCGLS
jgi:hypothetical protein